ERVGQRVLKRAELERERGTELVGDVAEEIRLGAVPLGQRLGPAAFRLVRAGGGHVSGDVSGHELEEVLVTLVERAPGTHSGNEETRRLPLRRGTGERQNERLVWREWPGSTRKPGAPAPQIGGPHGSSRRL